MDDNLDGVSAALAKIIKQLGQVEELTKKITTGSKDLTDGLSSLGSGNPISTNAASFSGSATTSNGMGVPSFGGKALTAAAVGLGVANAAFGALPGVQDAYAYQNTLFPVTFGGAGYGYNDANTTNRLKAAFAGSNTSTTDQNAAGALATSRGFTMAGNSIDRPLAEAGAMSKMTGMSNVQTTAGATSLQTGAAGISGKLSQYGIFTNNLSSGSYNGIGSVVDQLWARWYGSKSAKVPKVVYDADLMGGFLGRDVEALFGSQPELKAMILKALEVKAKSGGMAGIDFSNTAKGPKSGNALAAKMGLNSTNTPYLQEMQVNESRVAELAAASDSLLDGYRAGSTVIIELNKKMTLFADTGLGEATLAAKGFAETLAMASETSGIFNGILGALGGVLTGLLGGRVLGGGKSGGGATGGGAAAHGGSTARPGTGTTKPPLRTPTAARTPMARGTSSAALLGVAVADLGVEAGRQAAGQAMGIPAEQMDPAAPIINGPGDVYLPGPGGSTVGSARITPDMSPKDQKFFYEMWSRSVNNEEPTSAEYAQAESQYGFNFGDGAGGSAGGAFGAGKGGPREPSAAVNWAAGPATKMKSKFPGLCDRYVANAYGLAHSNYTDARAHWDGIPGRYRHPGDENPPAGALVFWNNGDHGHAALVVSNDGDNPMVSTTHTRGGTPTTMPLKDINRQIGAYRGWTTPYFHGNVADIKGTVGAASSSDPKSPNAAENSNPNGTPTMPTTGNVSAYALANPLAAAMGGSSSSIFGTSYRSVEPFASSDTNPTKTSGDDLGGTKGKDGETYMGKGKLLNWLRNAGFKGEALRTAWAVAMRESGGRPSAYNGNQATGDNSYGLFQINMLGKLGEDRRKKYGLRDNNDLLNPETNARVAFKMTNKGRNWFSWDIDANGYDGGSHAGKYQEYYAKYPGASHGMMQVAHDGPVNVHAGETIMPAAQSQEFRAALQEVLSGSRRGGGDVNINVTLRDASNEEAMRLVNIVKKELKSDMATDRQRRR